MNLFTSQRLLSTVKMFVGVAVVAVGLLMWHLGRVRYIIGVGGYRHWVLYARGDAVRLSDGFHTYRLSLKDGSSAGYASYPGITPTMLVSVRPTPTGAGLRVLSDDKQWYVNGVSGTDFVVASNAIYVESVDHDVVQVDMRSHHVKTLVHVLQVRGSYTSPAIAELLTNKSIVLHTPGLRDKVLFKARWIIQTEPTFSHKRYVASWDYDPRSQTLAIANHDTVSLIHGSVNVKLGLPFPYSAGVVAFETGTGNLWVAGNTTPDYCRLLVFSPRGCFLGASAGGAGVDFSSIHPLNNRQFQMLRHNAAIKQCTG